MSATLVQWYKARVHGHFVVEVRIYAISDSAEYPDGFKYSLICKDLISARRVLIDNHHPKHHHVHLDGKQFPYDFGGVEKLVDDFAAFVREHLGVTL